MKTVVTIIVGISLLLIAITWLMSRYDTAANFRQCNYIEFRHQVLQKSKLQNDAYDAFLEEYLSNQPSMWVLLLSRKRYTRENFYTKDQIDTYFTPFA